MLLSFFLFTCLFFTFTLRLCRSSMTGTYLYEYQENLLWTAEKNTPALRLLRDLTRNYNPNVRPVLNDSDTTVVEHLYILHQIVYLDSKEQRLKALYFEVWKWEDQFLQWDPQDYGGIQEVTLSREQVWMPDIVVYNELGDNYNYFMKENLIPVNINYNGEVKCETPLMLETICMLDISDFPYDRQDCKVKVGSWSQPVNKITILPTNRSEDGNGIDLSKYLENSEWKLLETYSVNDNNMTYPGAPMPFSELEYTLVLERRKPFYEQNMILPTVLTSSMSILVFLLPPESGEKISLAITIFLALSLNMLVISDHIPVNSLQIPVVSKYCLFSLGTITVSLWMSIIVINIHGYRTLSNTHYITHPPQILVKLSRKLWPYISIRNTPVTMRKKSSKKNESSYANGPTCFRMREWKNKGDSTKKPATIYQNGVVELSTDPMYERHAQLENNGSIPSQCLYSRIDEDCLKAESQCTLSANTRSIYRTNPNLNNISNNHLQNTYNFNSNHLQNTTMTSNIKGQGQCCSVHCSILETLILNLTNLSETIVKGLPSEHSDAGSNNQEADLIVQEWTLMASVLDRLLAIFYLVANGFVTVYCFYPYYP
ncbi:acetylcholine receptor subunit beta-like 2 [Symsagittifera roscoffensis]|uniref:acetylcholine receptor subunit beta-like 2 n=1 Tax=Symsagittifera roscoffensis TaxID=84072 RepID=UPI00307BBF24